MEPACAVLEFPVSTYYAAKKRGREPSAREQRDEWLKKEIMRVWEDRRKGRRVYGARKVWRQLRRDGIEVARCTVARLMKEHGFPVIPVLLPGLEEVPNEFPFMEQMQYVQFKETVFEEPALLHLIWGITGIRP